jgi:hypothetical protein
MNSSEEHILRSKDSFSEVDDIKGHPKNMLSATLLNSFWKNGVPNHELILKVGDICLVTCAIHGLGLANNSRVHIIDLLLFSRNRGHLVFFFQTQASRHSATKTSSGFPPQGPKGKYSILSREPMVGSVSRLSSIVADC